MAFGRRFGSKPSYYARGGPPRADGEPDWEPKVNKDPYYRTMDILNGVFKKSIKLEAGKQNSTDLKTITVNFGESWFRPIVEYMGQGKDADHSIYRFSCGHDWEGKAGNPVDGTKKGPCWVCGSQQSYLGFEHEWQHNIFKSDLVARAAFVEQYAAMIATQAPHVDQEELKNFLNLLVNAFDDLRCNSLWEKVYPGSAQAIWDRWKRLTEDMKDKVDEHFLAYIFAVAFNVPTDPKGEFEPLRPVVEWGVSKVKYRGFMNMLVDVRVVLDRCMGALLAKCPPPPPKPQQPPQAQQQPPQPQQGGDSGQDTQQSSGSEDLRGDEQDASARAPGSGEEDASGADGEAGEPGGDSGEDRDGDSSDDSHKSEGDPVGGVLPPKDIPASQQVQASPQERSDALKKLMAGAKQLDEKELHKDADPVELQNMTSQAVRAMIAQVLGKDVNDIVAIDQQLSNVPDNDMQQALQQLQNTVNEKSRDSQLTSNAKARILLVHVAPEGVKNDTSVRLTEDERFSVTRMRAAFYRSLGRQKARMSMDGHIVDVPSAIQYMADHQDASIFENDATQQGFAYGILTDMSGSMRNAFSQVCHASEMLKQALKFPFVIGNLWGFRGGEDVPGRKSETAEVWMYKYDKACTGYTGTAKHSSYWAAANRFQTADIPVRCGGLTPMNSAVNVVVTHLWRRMPASMAKRLFLLTDGSPMHTKVNGQGLPQHMLQAFVAKEIQLARQHGIQVYTIVIGENSISDEECKKMFGDRRFWRKTEGTNVYKELRDIVLANFTKYIKARG